jgi:predicted translin family RNA/ssDNA-binding protein
MRKGIGEATKSYEAFEKNRAACMQDSGRLRAESKAAVNFIVKGDLKRARACMAAARRPLARLNRALKRNAYLYSVPNLNEGLEEYVEAALLLTYVAGGDFPTPSSLGINFEAYIGGLCDMTGELVRLARNRPEWTRAILSDVSSINDDCVRLHVRRNNKIRSKLQDLERNLRRLEEILYEQRLRGRARGGDDHGEA